MQDSNLRSPLQHAPAPKAGEVDRTPPISEKLHKEGLTFL